jgi:trehalose/maltose hydrolase-like predicted phosphorylase
MIRQSAYHVDPWSVRESKLDLDLLAQSESVFALSNGHIGLRGNLDEGEPHGIPGTYISSFYEERPLPYAEAGYGYPESSQSILNATNGKLIRLLVNDEPLDVRYGALHAHTRVLDLRAGTLTRELDWSSPAARRVKVRATRLVSFTQRAVAAIEYVVEAVDAPVRLIIQSELTANETLPEEADDPRRGWAFAAPLIGIDLPGHDAHSISETHQAGATMLHRTKVSGLRLAAGMQHDIGPAEPDSGVQHEGFRTTVDGDCARSSLLCQLEPGEQVRFVKFLAYGWSAVRSPAALRAQIIGALTSAKASGFEGLLQEQREYLDAFWRDADVHVEGDPEIQQAVRFGLFHVLQSGARTERRCIPAKGLTGPGYDGHTFWDAEAYVLPILAYTTPTAAADDLRWRHSTLPAAKQRAHDLGFAGAAFPWRTIAGQECSGYWPAGTAAMHINADIAIALDRYRMITGDEALEREIGVELLTETARLWMSLGNHDADGRWHVVGVTGPDEYTALVADNVFTNLAAARNLTVAADAAQRHPNHAAKFGVDSEEIAQWRDAAAAVFVPYDERLRVHPQSLNFTQQPEWNFAANRKYPLLLHAHYLDLYRKQVVKQADLELAMFWFGDRFSDEDKARNVDYYERRTVRDSSLSACIQAIMAADVGHLELAHEYTYEAAAIDLNDLHHNTRDGLHIGSLAGTWMALVAGFGGLREREAGPAFNPQLPELIERLRFQVRWRGVRIQVDIRPTQVTYTIDDGEDATLTIFHAAEQLDLKAGHPQTRPIKARKPMLERPAQPLGREPTPRMDTNRLPSQV